MSERCDNLMKMRSGEAGLAHDAELDERKGYRERYVLYRAENSGESYRFNGVLRLLTSIHRGFPFVVRWIR
jgi:hypothetical protein